MSTWIHIKIMMCDEPFHHLHKMLIIAQEAVWDYYCVYELASRHVAGEFAEGCTKATI